MTHFSHAHTSKKGFTLIELLVVISIIGLLSTIVLSSLASARGKAEIAKTQSELHQIRLVLEQYYDDYGGYPYLGGDAYCFGGPCKLGNLTVLSPTNTLSFKKTESVQNLASVIVPSFGTSKTVTVDGVEYSGYIYVSCTSPVTSSLAASGYVCPADSDGTNVFIVTPVGNNIDTASAADNFILGSYTYSGGGSDVGSDSGSDSGSDGGYSDIDNDGISDSSDNCPSTYNPYQTDYNGYEDGYGNGDDCESMGS